MHQAAPFTYGHNNKLTPRTDEPASYHTHTIIPDMLGAILKAATKMFLSTKTIFLLCTSHLLLHCHLQEVCSPQPNSNYSGAVRLLH